MKAYLNLGCGERVHPDWINIDIAPSESTVTAHDFTKGIPFPAESADVVYHAAVLEHVRREDVAEFLREIYRVLKPGGIVRIGVPDLETICRTYLEKLEAALAGDKQAAHDYDWMMLEMFDQMVREQSGGEMVNYLRRQPLPSEQFIFQRIGNEGRKLVKTIRQGDMAKPFSPASFFRRCRAVARAFRHLLLGLVAGRDSARALAIGSFRLRGEVHQWMYDRFSLARALVAVGFHQPKLQSASESLIPDWNRFHLDMQPDGTLNKPDLLFMEAVKPND